MNHNIKDECTRKLVAISAQLSSTDKDSVKAAINYSRPTVERYLKGEGPKINVAFDLLNYFSKVLEERKKDLKRVDSVAA